MQRRILEYLKKWKLSPFRKPLIIHGARQVGKTYAIRELFGPSAFKKMVYVDFRADDDVRKYVKNHPNARKIIDFLSLRFDVDIDGDTLLVFDEAQEAVQILTAAKYFAQDYPTIPVIITGSLVRLRLKQLENDERDGHIRLDPEIEKENQDGHNNFLYPVGKVDQVDLYGMTFDEFLLSYRPRLYEVVKLSATEEYPLDEGTHELAIDAFYLYLRLGGMPEVVDIYLRSGSLRQAQTKIEAIFNDYLADMGLYQVSSQTIARTRMVFHGIYRELSKENKNYKIGNIEPGKRYRDYLNAFDWLDLSRLILRSRLTKERISSPLSESEESLFRVYLPDCGLFAYESKVDLASFEESLKRSTLSGVYFENYVAEELSARGIPLFYWKGKTSSELEFILDSGRGFIPIDAKKNKGSLDSLANFSLHNSYEYAIKVSQNRFGFNKEQRLKTIPLYALPFYLDAHFSR